MSEKMVTGEFVISIKEIVDRFKLFKDEQGRISPIS